MNDTRSAAVAPTQQSTPENRSVLPPRSTLIGGLLAIVAVIALLIHGLSGHREAPAPAPFAVSGDAVTIAAGSPTWHYVELAKAALADRPSLEPEPGRVAFDEPRSSPVVAPLPGRVESVAVLLGQRVEQGQRLISIRSAALVDLFRERDVERAREAAKSRELERVRALAGLHAVPEKDLVSAEQELREERLAREASERKLSSLSVATDGEEVYWLTASRPGVVVERDVLRGEEVGPDRANPLMVVADLDEVVVTADVPEQRVAGLHVGQEASVAPATAGEQPLTGKIEYIGEVVDPTRRMVNVRVRVPNPGHVLRPNAFVEVSFAAAGPPQVVIESEAVVSDDRKAFVFVQAGDQAAGLQRREVTTGWQRDGRVEILTGLQPGETYVRKGAILLLNALDLAN